MKIEYEKPRLEMSRFDIEDVLTASGVSEPVAESMKAVVNGKFATDYGRADVASLLN